MNFLKRLFNSEQPDENSGHVAPYDDARKEAQAFAARMQEHFGCAAVSVYWDTPRPERGGRWCTGNHMLNYAMAKQYVTEQEAAWHHGQATEK